MTEITFVKTRHNPVYIYGLFDPRNLELRYIGKSNNPRIRLKKHINGAIADKGANPHRKRWIRQLLNEGLEPAIEVLEECTEDNWQEIEKAWIKEAREKGLNLINILDGGDGFESGERHLFYGLRGEQCPHYGFRPSEKTKLKMSQSSPKFWLGKSRSEESKRKMSENKKGKMTGEKNYFYGRDKSGNKNPMFGHKQSNEAKEKISQSRLGKYLGSDNPNYGNKNSELVKLKMSLSQKISHAYRTKNTLRLIQLQQEYFNIFGNYNKRFPHD